SSDAYVVEAINYAGEKTLNYAIKQHQRGNYHASLTYYNRIINEELVEATLKTRATIHRDQAEVKETYKSSFEYLQEVKRSGSVTEMWELAQESKTLFSSSDAYVVEAINYAAEKTLNYAIKQHQRGNYHASLTYYNRIINEELVEATLKTRATIYEEQREGKETKKSSSEYLQEENRKGS